MPNPERTERNMGYHLHDAGQPGEISRSGAYFQKIAMEMRERRRGKNPERTERNMGYHLHDAGQPGEISRAGAYLQKIAMEIRERQSGNPAKTRQEIKKPCNKGDWAIRKTIY